jgi:hypothetical protein
MTGIDLANVPKPAQNALFKWRVVMMEIITNAMARESNIPQIPDRIMVNGQSIQKRKTQTELFRFRKRT